MSQINSKITKMQSVSVPMSGEELFEIVQNGRNCKVSVTELMKNAPGGKSAYEVAKTEGGYEGTVQQWLESLRGPKGQKGDKGDKGDTGPAGPQGPKGEPGDGGSGGGGTPSTTIRVTGWSGNDFDLPEGVTVEKEYSDTSIKIQHNRGKFPTGWFGFNRESSPWTAMVPSSTRNMQIVDENTVIITSVGSFEVFDISLHFA